MSKIDIEIKEPTGEETSTSKNDIKSNLVDPAGIIDPSTGEKQFLNWKVVIEDDEEIYKAVGRDGKIYKVVEDKPPVVKNYKIVIEEPTGEEPTTPEEPHPLGTQNIDSGKIEDQ